MQSPHGFRVLHNRSRDSAPETDTIHTRFANIWLSLANRRPLGQNGPMGDARITMLLGAIGRGERDAADELLPIVYDELRQLAQVRMQKIPPGQTLQATALVHEVYVRLLGGDDPEFANRSHFFFAAARAMHQILVEQARRKFALKRGGDRKRVSADTFVVAATEIVPSDMLALDEALQQLEQEDERAYRLVMLRFFAGLTEKQAAEVLGVTDRTVRRDWLFARTKLYKMLNESPSDDDSETP